MRGDGYIEPIHWLAIWMRTDGCDVPLVLDRLGVGREELVAGVQRALEGLRRARSSRLDFSRDLELAIERGWISASLVFGSARIRTGAPPPRHAGGAGAAAAPRATPPARSAPWMRPRSSTASRS